MFLNDLGFILMWWISLLAIGFSFLPLTQRIFSLFFDKGYIFSKVIGLTIISYSIYTAASIRLLKFNLENIIIVWILSSILTWILFKKDFQLRKLIKVFITEEIFFLIALIIWSFIRGYQPSIHDLEKFMDFGFLNSILRTDYFPPKDMWFTPLSINYYYFGHLFTAILTKVTNIPSYASFNLMIATLFAFTLSLSFSIGANLISKIKNAPKYIFIFSGIITGFFVTLSGNLQTIYSLFIGYNSESPTPFWNLAISLSTFPNSYWYPNATRFIYHTIHEFPSYSFVVADLHGHVLDIPIVLTIIAVLIHAFMENKLSKLFIATSAFLLSIAYMTNAWDALIYLGLSALTIIMLIISDKKLRSINIVKQLFKYSSSLLILFFLFTYLFNKNFSPFASGIGLNCSPEFLVKLGKIGPFIFETNKCNISPIWQLGTLYGFFIFTLISFLIFIRKRAINVSDKTAILFAMFSLLLIVTPEFFYLKDIYEGYFRANTMFKLTYQAFIISSITSSYFIIRIILNIKEFKFFRSRIFLYLFIVGELLLIFFIAIYPYFSIPSGYGDLKKHKGLDGLQYLKEIKPYDYEAINWINAHIKGQPVILEAQGDSYTDYARISSNTGLPTVLGWTVHEWLWRGSYEIPSSRFSDIKNLFETNNIQQTKMLINKYKISYVYIGVLEKEKYQIKEDKFSKMGKIIYSNKGTKIYKIN